jgi:hypothetical protein
VDEAEKGPLLRTRSQTSLKNQQLESPGLLGAFPKHQLNEKYSEDVEGLKYKGKHQANRSRQANFSPPVDVSKDGIDIHQDTQYEGPFAAQCAEDASIWEQYMSQAKVSDEELSKVLNSDLDSLLIFVISIFLRWLRESILINSTGWSVFGYPISFLDRSPQGSSRRPPSKNK